MGESGAPQHQEWSGQTVFVTGATGFIGRHLVRRLSKADCRLVLQTRSSIETERFETIPGDLRQPQSLAVPLREIRPDVVFHLGGMTSPVRDLGLASQAISVNFEATRILAEICGDIGCQSFVYASTSEVYGEQNAPFTEEAEVKPVSPYSTSKAMTELWLKMIHRSFDFPAVIARPFLCYGPGQPPPKLVPSAILAAIKGYDLPMTEGLQKRELTFVDDLVLAFELAALTPAARGEVLNFGEGNDIEIRHIVAAIYALAGQGGKPLFGAIEGRRNEMMRFAADVNKARDVLGWYATTPLEDGLRQTIDWARKNGNTPVPIDAD